MLDNANKSDNSPRQMLTVNEVAHLLHVHPNTVRLWSKIGALKAYRIGKRRDYRFNMAADRMNPDKASVTTLLNR